MSLFGPSRENINSCEMFAMDLVANIWNDCMQFQSVVPAGIYFETEKFFVDEVIFQTHLLQMVAAKISPKNNAIILEAISTHGFGEVEKYHLRSFSDLPLDFRRLLVKRKKEYRDFDLPSAFTTNDYPHPNLFSFSASLFFSDPETLDKCLTLKKHRAKETYAQFIELIYLLD